MSSRCHTAENAESASEKCFDQRRVQPRFLFLRSPRSLREVIRSEETFYPCPANNTSGGRLLPVLRRSLRNANAGRRGRWRCSPLS